MNDEKSRVKFIVILNGWPGNAPNTCYLQKDNWNDWGFVTSFRMSYVDSSSKKFDIGIIKIMFPGQTREVDTYTTMPEEFYELDEKYCSLGQSQDYYENLMDLQGNAGKNILKSLRDCVFEPEIYTKNEDEEVMQTSLLRAVDSRNITGLFKSILFNYIELTSYHFQYLLNSDKNTLIDVKVDLDSNPPSNVHVLIGRNGVGKTSILSGMVDQLTKTNEPDPMSQKGELKFIPSEFNHYSGQGTEEFASFVTVIFSAFDNFKPSRNNLVGSGIPHHYIGLKTEEGNRFKSPENLKEDFLESIKVCFVGRRKERWINSIEILNSDPIFKEYNLEEVINHENACSEIEKIFTELSSGHRIVLLTITKLVELVNEKTLVIIDEPENHLHPPLLSSFIRAISNLLTERNGVALIATHSPVVLKEVPRICVTKIDRVDSSYALNRPENETCAENIDILTRDVFRLEIENSGFYKIINDFLEEEGASYEGLMEKFGNQIGSEGRSLARSIILNRDNKDAQFE